MKILLLIKGLGLGGAERHLVDLAKWLKENGDNVRVAYMIPGKNALVQELQDAQIPVEPLGGAQKNSFFACLIGFLRLCQRERFDVVHAHLPLPGLLARLGKGFFAFRLVYTEHNVFQRLHSLTRLAHRASRWIDDVAISCSSAVADSLPWVSQTIRNGIVVYPPCNATDRARTREELALDDQLVVFVCVANLVRKKNHGMLIRSFAEFVGGRAAGDAKLLLVGQDGTERKSLEQLVRALGIHECVIFMGPQRDVRRVLCAADVFCLSSDYEGLPLALLEAMALQLPAIVTDVGGMAEAVNDGECGIVVQPNDQPAMAEAMRKLALSGSFRKRAGELARMRVMNEFSVERMAEEIRATYVETVR